MPDASEGFILRETLLHANSDLNGLHGDIAHIQAILDELRLKCEPLRKFITEQNTILARLKRVRFVMSRRGEWLADAEILNRLHKCQQEGMIISIIEKGDYKKKDLLDILVT